MAKPLSEDLRIRVVEVIEGGATIPEAAEQCGVSISSVGRFLRLHRETGSVSSAKFGGYKGFHAGGARGPCQAIGGRAARHHTGGARGWAGEEEDHGR